MQAKQITFEMEVPEQVLLKGLPRIKQVFINLLSNAVEVHTRWWQSRSHCKRRKIL